MNVFLNSTLCYGDERTSDTDNHQLLIFILSQPRISQQPSLPSRPQYLTDTQNVQIVHVFMLAVLYQTAKSSEVYAYVFQ